MQQSNLSEIIQVTARRRSENALIKYKLQKLELAWLMELKNEEKIKWTWYRPKFDSICILSF